MAVMLVDYGAGNLASVRKGFAAVGVEVLIAERPEDLAATQGIVIPGVGHFGAAASLDQAWRDAIHHHVRAGRPLLGICLGMQLLFEGSDEAPGLPGLGLLAGRCSRLIVERPLKVPHVGWNALAPAGSASLLDSIPAGAQVYFTHAYAAPVTADTVATTSHGTVFAAAVQRGSVGGVQFHPEKSGETGLRILRNFARMTGH